MKSCPKCGNTMLFKEAKKGLPSRYVCTGCGHDEVQQATAPNESTTGKKQTLVD